LQETADREFSAAMLAERADFLAMTQTEQANLTAKGMIFNKPDIAPFRAMLAHNGFYPEMRALSGDKAWSLLEKYVGELG
jgi:hypothetical protein